MAFGDSLAALIGERYGKRRYKIFAQKTVEGSLMVFAGSLLSVLCYLAFYTLFHPFSIAEILALSLGVACIATIIEAVSPLGVDNLTVPHGCAVFAYFLLGG